MTATEYQADYAWSCIRCWHDRSYHTTDGCTASHDTTDGPLPCDCPHFYHRNQAIELIDSHLAAT